MRIAILDNDRSLLRSLRIILSRLGYDVRCFATPHEALRSLDGVDGPDAILVDFVMPQMTGVEFLLQAGGQLPGHCRRILITGHAEAVEQADLAKASIDALFAKPLDLNSIVSFLRSGAA